MKNIELNANESKYITSIIKSLKMDVNIFLQNLSARENFEITVYQWSINLFNEGKSIEKAISIIKERIKKVIQNNIMNDQMIIDDQTELKKFKKIITDLESREIYNNLGSEEKNQLITKIMSFIETRLYDHLSIVNFALEIIEHDKKIERKNQMAHYKNKSSFDYSRIRLGI